MVRKKITHTHGHGPHEDPGSGKKGHDKRYFNSRYGLGSSKTKDAKKKQKRKTDRILHVLFILSRRCSFKDGMLGKKR